GEWGPILLLEYVFLEIVTVLSARRDLATAVSVGEILLGAREIELVPCSPHFLSAYQVFRELDATGLSFTDAAIVAVARDREADAIATFDRDFHDFPDRGSSRLRNRSALSGSRSSRRPGTRLRSGGAWPQAAFGVSKRVDSSAFTPAGEPP
ncbi:MAG TPA: PIN domain-containing protein, partial [Gemmatimonadota bacterium]|nr:PIN domain-containing protein [Gemmatimonadota bacterium]